MPQEAVGGQGVSPGPEPELSGVFWQLELWAGKWPQEELDQGRLTWGFSSTPFSDCVWVTAASVARGVGVCPDWSPEMSLTDIPTLPQAPGSLCPQPSIPLVATTWAIFLDVNIGVGVGEQRAMPGPERGCWAGQSCVLECWV